MRFLNLNSAILALSLFRFCNGYDYWVDRSCTVRPDWDKYLQEALDMAGRSWDRLDSNTDTDFAAVFERIFHTPKTDQTNLDTVKNKRWVSRPAGGFLDSVNNMLFPSAWTQPSCREPGKGAFGELYRLKAPEPGPGKDGKPSPLAGQEANRAVMTICDDAFDKFPKMNNAPLKLDDYDKKKDLTKLPISHFAFLISMTILHEWTHHPIYAREDVPDGASYGWENIIAMGRDDSVGNSDSYSYLGLWALLADRPGPQTGYTLPRLGNPVNQQADQDCKDGKIAYYHQITRRKAKRWVDVVARRFRA